VSAADEALAAGRALARRLAQQAIRDGELCAFHGATPAPTPGQPAHWRVFGGDYYDGSAGIARLLARAAAMGAGAEVARTAEAALAHAIDRTEGWSLMSGRLGVGLVMLEAAPLLPRPGLAEIGAGLCREAADAAIAEAQRGSAPLDLLGGLAGVLHAVARLARREPGAWASRAEALGALLAAHASAAPVGRSWAMHPADPQHLCGLGHGAAGVALALSDLAGISPERRRWRALAAEARLFERSHFDPGTSSWADLRADVQLPGQPPAHPHFWCHGSVGVGHERLLAHRREPDCPLIAADLAAALTAARREAARLLASPAGPGAPFAANGSQCHGISGLLDLLAETGAAEDRARCLALAALVRNDSRRGEGWRSGNPGGEPAPGLMLGLAGIAWGQLRAARPDLVPVAWSPAPA
jgi:lantibiotic biosynthesis protein